MLTVSERHHRPGSRRRPSGSSPPLAASVGLICLLLFSAVVQGQASTDPRSSICIFNYHRTIVVGETLFIDGGQWVSNGGFDSNNTSPTLDGWQNEYLWRLNLTTTFSARSPPWEVEEKPSSPDAHYNGAEGTIWDVGMGSFTTIGGWFSMKHGPLGNLYGVPYIDQSQNFTLPAAKMFTYNVRDKAWSSINLDQGMLRVSTASSVSNQRLRRGYVLGGIFITEQSTGTPEPYPLTDTWLDKMMQYDFVRMEWKEEALPKGIGQTVDGGLIALDRVGGDGVLVFLGGEQRDRNGTQSRRSMETIWIYDIKTSKWHQQITTGEIPVGRRQSCFFMVPAPDLSSFQIYTFSGTTFTQTQQEPVTILDLYVLTVPGFIWTKISLTDAGYPDTYPMNTHQCSPHRDGRQIFIVPGSMNANRNTTNFAFLCNSGTGIKVFDTLEWKFRSNFDPTLTTPGVPKPIINLIGGTTTGGANVTAPNVGWQDSSLKAIFETRNEPITYSTGGGPVPSRIGKGAWAGIGVGVFIGLICLGGLFCCRRRVFRSGKGGENPPFIELSTQPDSVEAHGDVARQELSAGPQPPELMDMQGGKYVYSPKPDESQQHPGQGYGDGCELLPGAGPAGGVADAPGPAVGLGDHIHVHQQEGVHGCEQPISYEGTMRDTPYPEVDSPDQGVQRQHQGV